MIEFTTQAIAKLECEAQEAKVEKDQCAAKFSELAALNQLPVITHPYSDHDQTDRARRMRVAWVVASILGVTCFAILSMLSLNVELPPVLFFLAAAMVGIMFLVLFESAVIAIFHVNPKNPESHKSIDVLMTVCTIMAITSFTGFAYLRFTASDSPLVSLVSLIFVSFEVSVFGMAACFLAYVILNQWSDKITQRYTVACRTYEQKQNLIKSYKNQAISNKNQVSNTTTFQGGENEIPDYRPDHVNGHARSRTNGAASPETVDGKTAA